MRGSGRTKKARLDLPRFGKTGDEAVTYRDLELFAKRLQDWADNLKFGRIGMATYEDGRYHTLASTWTADPWPFTRLVEDSHTFSKRQPAGLNDIFEVPPGLGGNYALSWRFGAYQYTQTVTTYNYTGAKQTFTVPAGVTFVQLDVKGAQGESSGPSTGGKGGRVTGSIDVTAGDVLDIYVGEQPAGGAGGWPNGGDGGTNGASANAPGGGGASYVTPASGTVANAYIVAGAGGGGARNGASNTATGGYGGFSPTAGQEGYKGAGANNWPGSNGQPATSTAGGAGGDTTADGTASTAGEAGDTDGQGYGGDAGAGSNAFAFAGGGGGGGYHGGGGAVDPTGAGNYGGGGGGGISYLSSDVYDSGWTDDYQSGDGQVIVTYYTLSNHDTALTHVELMLARRDFKVADKYDQVEIISTDAGDPMHGAVVLPLGEGDRFWLRVTNTDTNVLYKENSLSAYRIAD